MRLRTENIPAILHPTKKFDLDYIFGHIRNIGLCAMLASVSVFMYENASKIGFMSPTFNSLIASFIFIISFLLLMANTAQMAVSLSNLSKYAVAAFILSFLVLVYASSAIYLVIAKGT